jgi:hypothetical protein
MGLLRCSISQQLHLKVTFLDLPQIGKKRLVIIMAQANEKEIMDWVLELKDMRHHVTLSQSCS